MQSETGITQNDQIWRNYLRKKNKISVVNAHEQISVFYSVYSLVFLAQDILEVK